MINEIVRNCDIILIINYCIIIVVWNILDALRMIIKWFWNKKEADSLKNNVNKIIGLV